jgi:NTP pyrophosphatase (non-canonical NTP hydrolase)
MELGEFQETVRRTFEQRDRQRGLDGTFRWMVEEVGELARALRDGDPGEREHEVGDVLAWLASVANISGVDLEKAAARYTAGCPVCRRSPCGCPQE